MDGEKVFTGGLAIDLWISMAIYGFLDVHIPR